MATNLKNGDYVISPISVVYSLSDGTSITQNKPYKVSDVVIYSHGTYFTIKTDLGNAIRCKLIECNQINKLDWIIKKHWFIKFLDKIAFLFD